MPDGRVMPDWEMRAGISDNGPYRSYHGAVGLFDRIEAHGAFTEIETENPFPGEGFGDYKDRSAGLKAVIAPEGERTPQIAVGVNDVTGTAVFGARYLAASKRIRDFDFTLGLGQGVLAGQDVSGIEAGGQAALDAGEHFLTSSPWRATRPFFGFSWRARPWLDVVAEYSSMDYESLYGFDGEQSLPVNAGVKIAPWEHVRFSAALMRGNDLALGAEVNLPLQPEALQAWRSEPEYRTTEKARWQAFEAGDAELAGMIARALKEDGFQGVSVSIGGSALMARARNVRHLSDARAFGRMGSVVTDIAPGRIETLFLVLTDPGGSGRGITCPRVLFEDYMASRISLETFQAYSQQGGQADLAEIFESRFQKPETFDAPDSAMAYEIKPMLETFLENRSGFFKHKAGFRQRASFEPWEGGRATIEVETVLYNEYDDLVFQELESEPARTDLVRYESGHGSRVSTMALEQTFDLPLDAKGRMGWGALDSAYTGVGGELFRYFADDRLGVGVEGQVLRKRDPESSVGLDPNSWRIFTTAYVNFYGVLLPEQGLAAGLKIGRFLAGDVGARLDVSRTFRHFTLGAWVTITDTGHLESSKNVGHRDKGVYISIPLSIFRFNDAPGHFSYGLSSFTRDPGQIVTPPNPLYPMAAGGEKRARRLNLEEMRMH